MSKTDRLVEDDAHPEWLSTLCNISRDVEDEGDRMYFGSTNDADELAAVVAALEAAGVPERFFKRPDFHKHNTELRTHIEALEAQVERLTEELGRIKLVLRSTLPVGSDRTPDDRVQAFYLRAGELRALRALAQDGDSHE